MTSHVESQEVRSLVARLSELERDRSDARDQATTLMALQDAFAAIARCRSIEAIIAIVLRAIVDPLGFRRAIFFDAGRENGVTARYAIDGSDVVEPCHDRPDLRSDSAFVALLRGEAGDGTGFAGELSAPIVDVRRWYVMGALQRSDGTVGIVYADDHRSTTLLAWEAGLVRALVTIAAVAIDNAVLFARTQELATRDPLTGLLNRRAFGERVAEEFAHVRGPRALAYLLIDVDDFKKVNDADGHAYGDTVLKLVASTLVQSCRAHDIIGRFAGDEFVALLVDVDAEKARVLVSRISNDFRAAGLRCSLGAALFPHDGSDPETVFIAADRALYATKAAGKNGYSFAS